MVEPDNYYYNFEIRNDNAWNVNAIGEDNRQDVICQTPEKYNISIVRFTTDTFFPLFFATIPDEKAPLVTDMSITFGYSGSHYGQFVNITANEAKDGIWSIGEFLTNINAASLAAFTALKVGSPASTAQMAPFFAFNPDTQLVSMYLDEGWLETSIPPTEIYFNSQLQSLLNFPALIFRPPPNPLGLDFRVLVRDYAKLLPPIATRFGFPLYLNNIAHTIIQVEQEFQQPQNFSDIDKIMFSSRAIPAITEYIPSAIQGSTTDNFMPVLTDFVVGGTSERNSFIEYLPTAEYRRISMKPSAPLQRVDIQVTYSRYAGQIYPLILPPGGKTTIKFLFEKKAEYKTIGGSRRF